MVCGSVQSCPVKAGRTRAFSRQGSSFCHIPRCPIFFFPGNRILTAPVMAITVYRILVPVRRGPDMKLHLLQGL